MPKTEIAVFEGLTVNFCQSVGANFILRGLRSVSDFEFEKNIAQINTEDYKDQRVVIKGCGELPISETAYVAITNQLRPVVKSIMYGEPCSTVPVYKKPRIPTV